MGAGAWAVGVDATYLSRPLTLVATSPAPGGREVRVVDDVLDTSVSATYSPVPRLEMDAVLPFAAYRTGTGTTGVTSQTGPDLQTSALRDLRLGAAYAIVARRLGRQSMVAMTTRLDLALPTGSAGSFAGDRGPVIAPSLGFELEHHALFAAAELGARLREPVEIGTVHLASELVWKMGLGAHLLDRERFDVAIETWALPTLVSQSRTLPDGTRADGVLVPAEWMASVRTRSGPVTMAVGGGGAIPLSSQTQTGPDGASTTDHFAGITSPGFRLALVLRYAPPAPRQ